MRGMDVFGIPLKVIISPFICALIGWFTNLIAIKMLFHPKKPVKFLFFTLHGVFPKRQKALAYNLGELVENELISHEDIQKVINDPEFEEKFKGYLLNHLSGFFEEKLASLNPLVTMFLNGSLMNKIKDTVFREVDKAVPSIIQQILEELRTKVDFSEIVRKKVEAFSMDKLEDILFTIMKKEFKFVELMGAVLGFIVGIFQAAMFVVWA